MNRKLARARSGLPVTAESIYLSTGSWGPTSRVFASTLRRLTLEESRHGRMSPERFEAMHRATESIRTALAALVNVPATAIALTGSTSAGLESVFRQLPWRRGDEVVCTQLEHRALTQPLRDISRQMGVDVRLAHVPEEGAANLDWLSQCVTPQTRLIAFTAVSYTTGQRLPLEAIGAFGRAQGVMTLVDAAQWIGAVPLDLARSEVDFCAFPLQKWLGGAEGMGGLYVRDEAWESLRRDRVSQSRAALEATAAHLQWLEDKIGWDFIYTQTRALAERAREAFSGQPAVRLVTPDEYAGLITVDSTRSHADNVARLEQHRIVLRSWPEQCRYRLSTAFFNSDDEIDTVAAAFCG